MLSARELAVLTARVTARNRAAAVAAELCPAIRAIFAGREGSKVMKVDGSLLKSIADEVKTIIDEGTKGCTGSVAICYRNRSDYSLSWTVKCSENVAPDTFGAGCVYEEATFYVANLIGQTLDSWNGCDFVPGPVYVVDGPDGLVEKLEAYAVAKKAAADAESALFPFADLGRIV